MSKFVKTGKKVVGLFSLSLLLGLSSAVIDSAIAAPVVAVASELSEPAPGKADVEETDTAGAEAITDAEAAETTGIVTQDTTDPEDRGFNAKEKFIIFTCCLFSVAFCLVVALWGNPNDRLKDKYKRARKQQQLQEKKKQEAKERAEKRAAAEAKYAEELAQYEADMKAYEEEKALKAAAKEAKKAEKKAKKK